MINYDPFQFLTNLNSIASEVASEVVSMEVNYSYKLLGMHWRPGFVLLVLIFSKLGNFRLWVISDEMSLSNSLRMKSYRWDFIYLLRNIDSGSTLSAPMCYRIWNKNKCEVISKSKSCMYHLPHNVWSSYECLIRFQSEDCCAR
jgi:hypothetical protein